MNGKLPSFFKEGMFEAQPRTGVVAFVEPKVGVANDGHKMRTQYGRWSRSGVVGYADLRFDEGHHSRFCFAKTPLLRQGGEFVGLPFRYATVLVPPYRVVPVVPNGGPLAHIGLVYVNAQSRPFGDFTEALFVVEH